MTMWDSLIDSLDPELADNLIAEFKTGWQVEAGLAAAKQARIAQATDRIASRAIDGVGQHVARITPEAFFYWRNRLGHECWADPGFRREFLRDNPGARVEYHRKPMIQR